MEIRTLETIEGWLREHQIDLALLEKNTWPGEGTHSFVVEGDSGFRTALGRDIAWEFGESTTLLWIQVVDVWESSQNMLMFQMLRKAVGDGRTVYEAPFQLFSPVERELLQVFTTVCLYFNWEFILIDSAGDLSIAFNHHEEMTFGGNDIRRVTELAEGFGTREGVRKLMSGQSD
jgi:hypothetical protein